ATGDLEGTVTLEVVSAVDGETYRSNSLPTTLSFRDVLAPRVDRIDTEQLIFVNDKITVEGDGFLLSAGEGETVAIVGGCFMDAESGSVCVDVAAIEVPLVPVTPFDRTRATFAFHPAIAGIRPGIFDGDVVVRNRQPTAE